MDEDRIIGAAKNGFGKVKAAVGSATGDAQTEAEGKVAETEGFVQNTFGQAKDAVRDIAQGAADKSKTLYQEGGGAIAEGVQRHPSSALLMAGVIGFALGVMFTRRSQPPRGVLNRYYYR
jgi:uncharacterized protein YjbJ (UPF0337 family)